MANCKALRQRDASLYFRGGVSEGASGRGGGNPILAENGDAQDGGKGGH